MMECYAEPHTYNLTHTMMLSIPGNSQGHTHVYAMLRTHKIIPESQNVEGGGNVWGRMGNRHVLKLDDDDSAK